MLDWAPHTDTASAIRIVFASAVQLVLASVGTVPPIELPSVARKILTSAPRLVLASTGVTPLFKLTPVVVALPCGPDLAEAESTSASRHNLASTGPPTRPSSKAFTQAFFICRSTHELYGRMTNA